MASTQYPPSPQACKDSRWRGGYRAEARVWLRPPIRSLGRLPPSRVRLRSSDWRTPHCWRKAPSVLRLAGYDPWAPTDPVRLWLRCPVRPQATCPGDSARILDRQTQAIVPGRLHLPFYHVALPMSTPRNQKEKPGGGALLRSLLRSCWRVRSSRTQNGE